MAGNKKNVVVIGGGTGSSVVLSGLKNFPKLNLTATVVVSDSGGSAGRLRDEFGFLAVGDLRQCLASLADGELQNEIRDILLYRFKRGKGLKGHNLGNLILTTLEDIYKSPGKAIEVASQIFRIKGQIYPITEKVVDLVIEYKDGTIKIGEDTLDNSKFGGKKISQIKLSPKASIYFKTAKAIEQADLIVIGPGDLYASLLPHTLVKGFKKSLHKSRAQFVYILNLMTHYSQTNNMTAQNHLDEIIKYSSKHPDVVVVNNQNINQEFKTAYAQQKEYPVIDDLPQKPEYKIIRDNFLSKVRVEQNPHDKVRRSFLRHNEKKLAKLLNKLAINK